MDDSETPPYELKDAYFQAVLNCLFELKLLSQNDVEELVKNIFAEGDEVSHGSSFQHFVSAGKLLPDLIFKSIQLGEYLVKTGNVSTELCIEALSNEIRTGERLGLYLHRKSGYRFP